MTWIATIDEETATGDLKTLYDEIRRQAGAVANILKVHSQAPGILKTHLQFYSAVMHAPGELSRRHREMIAVAVSAANDCEY